MGGLEAIGGLEAMGGLGPGYTWRPGSWVHGCTLTVLPGCTLTVLPGCTWLGPAVRGRCVRGRRVYVAGVYVPWFHVPVPVSCCNLTLIPWHPSHLHVSAR